MSSEADAGKALILFGATGDLATRMLFPSLAALERDQLLPAGLKIIAVSRTAMTTDAFRDHLAAEVAHPSGLPGGALDRLCARTTYFGLDATKPEDIAQLRDAIGDIPDRTFYLSTSPSLYGRICAALKGAGLVNERARVVLEKPIGQDLASSRAVNAAVSEAFYERQILRVDHYLGKETVQNLLALRFGNTIFEPLWTSRSIDHVQITVAETLGVEDRWDYYDDYGALRDMVQNHILQLLCLLAMEPPARFDPESVRNEKVKVLRSLRRIGEAEIDSHTVRGQYGPGVADGSVVRGYAKEGGRESTTETFVALRAEIDNWRWAGVPFFLRTGKRLAERRTEIVVQFRDVPHSIFGAGQALPANKLIIHLQPKEGISLSLMNKRPGLTTDAMPLEELALNLLLDDPKAPNRAVRRIAYERLILDALLGNSTLFVRRDEVDAAWEWIDPIIAGWKARAGGPKPYASGSWGPGGAFALIAGVGRAWRE
jgi:glucose-6-phosphate 1-dehydrogenase